MSWFSHRVKVLQIRRLRSEHDADDDYLSAARRRRRTVIQEQFGLALVMLAFVGVGCTISGWMVSAWKDKKTPFEQALEREAKQPPAVRTLTITVDGQKLSVPFLLPGTNISFEIH